MADWSCNPGLDRTCLTGNYVSVTPGATAHTKGSWTTVFTNTVPRFGFQLGTGWMQNLTTARTMLFDIAVDGVVIASDIAVCPGGASGAANSRVHQSLLLFPVALPAGVVQIRAQSSFASHGYCGLTLFYGDTNSQLPCFARCETLGASLASTKGTVVTASSADNTFGSWQQIGVTSSRVRAFRVHAGHNNGWLNMFSDQNTRLEVGVGGTGSEVGICYIDPFAGTGTSYFIPVPQDSPLVLCDIPAGTTISCRLAVQWTTDQRVRDIIFYGFE